MDGGSFVGNVIYICDGIKPVLKGPVVQGEENRTIKIYKWIAHYYPCTVDIQVQTISENSSMDKETTC